jgi:8-hydroxy-5-deazaflavin:NADPH oxidoreductase
MRITVIGAGNVGKTLGGRFKDCGHEIVYAVRDPVRHRELAAAAQVKEVAAAVEASETILLATPWSGAADAIRSAGNLAGKVLIDATNPVAADRSGLALGFTDSAAEQLQRLAPEAHVVKAFNTVGFNIMADPRLEGRRAAMYVAGDSAEARKRVAALAAEIGFEVIDAGGLASARLLEPFAMLWIASALKFGVGRDFAFSVVRRQP